MTDQLAFTIRTPHEVVFEHRVLAARVPTPTGLAGIRPRGELVAGHACTQILSRDGGTVKDGRGAPDDDELDAGESLEQRRQISGFRVF